MSAWQVRHALLPTNPAGVAGGATAVCVCAMAAHIHTIGRTARVPARGILNDDNEGPGSGIPMAREFTLVPQAVTEVKTQYRRIVTPLHPHESLPILEKLYQ